MDTLEDQLAHLPIIAIGEICQKCGAKKDEGASRRPPGTPKPSGVFGSCNIDDQGNVTDCDQCASRMN